MAKGVKVWQNVEMSKKIHSLRGLGIAIVFHIKVHVAVFVKKYHDVFCYDSCSRQPFLAKERLDLLRDQFRIRNARRVARPVARQRCGHDAPSSLVLRPHLADDRDAPANGASNYLGDSL